MDTRGFLEQVRIDAQVLEIWIAEGWVVPDTDGPEPSFSEADVARARLIGDLSRDLGVNDEGIAVALDLIDQIHTLRRSLRQILDCLDNQPEETQRKLIEDICAAIGPRRRG